MTILFLWIVGSIDSLGTKPMINTFQIFNENNHLQLTVSQCVSEKKRSDINTEVVLQRAEVALKKACKFTRNITVKA